MKPLTKEINIKVIAYFDEDTNEPTCARWFGEKPLLCKFLLMRKFGQQPVCGYAEQIDLLNKTSRGLVKPKEDCPLHSEDKL